MNLIHRAAFAALALAVLWPCTTAVAESPRLTNVLPHGGQRGTEVEVRLTGSNLQDAEEVLLYDAGIEVTSLEVPPKDDKQFGRQVTVKFKIAENCEFDQLILECYTGGNTGWIHCSYVHEPRKELLTYDRTNGYRKGLLDS